MKPIIFSTEMVKAIQDGRKTQTRRVVKPQYRYDESGFQVLTHLKTGEMWAEKTDEDGGSFDDPRYVFPTYSVGDVLYVRETWQQVPSTKGGLRYTYKANNPRNAMVAKWKPSIHMPRDAARIFLRVTGVRVERLQDISEADSIAEGMLGIRPPSLRNSHAKRTRCTECAYFNMESGLREFPCPHTLRKQEPFFYYNEVCCTDAFNLRSDTTPEPACWHFAYYWDELQHKKKSDFHFWQSNPWVWVYEFERTEKP